MSLAAVSVDRLRAHRPQSLSLFGRNDKSSSIPCLQTVTRGSPLDLSPVALNQQPPDYRGAAQKRPPIVASSRAAAWASYGKWSRSSGAQLPAR